MSVKTKTLATILAAALLYAGPATAQTCAADEPLTRPRPGINLSTKGVRSALVAPLPAGFLRSQWNPSPRSPRPRIGRKVLGGIVGGIGGFVAGGMIGGALAPNHGDDAELRGIIVGAPIGAVLGAVAGVMLASR